MKLECIGDVGPIRRGGFGEMGAAGDWRRIGKGIKRGDLSYYSLVNISWIETHLAFTGLNSNHVGDWSSRS